jgi:hypothetical protein
VHKKEKTDTADRRVRLDFDTKDDIVAAKGGASWTREAKNRGIEDYRSLFYNTIGKWNRVKIKKKRQTEWYHFVKEKAEIIKNKKSRGYEKKKEEEKDEGLGSQERTCLICHRTFVRTQPALSQTKRPS